MKLNERTMKKIILSFVTVLLMGCDDSDSNNRLTSGQDANDVPGPGANLSCASTGKNAFETFGANAFVAVNDYTDGVKYFGSQDMTEKHTGLAITGAQYDYFVTNIVVPALTSNGVSTNDVSSCFAPPLVDAAFKASVVGH